MSAGEKDLAEAIVSIGFSKDSESLRVNLPVFNALVPRVLKMRMMGSAALALVFVAGGRFDAYIESGIHIWDIAAGGFILERAGGEFWRTLGAQQPHHVVQPPQAVGGEDLELDHRFSPSCLCRFSRHIHA